MDAQAALDALAWQIELGATEAIGEHPVNRFEESQPDTPAKGAALAVPRAQDAARGTAGDARSGPADASSLAANAQTLDDLAAVIQAWEGSPLKAGARSFVFSDGNPAARLMVIGEAPGAEEDRQGKPFVGRAGQLLDRMLAAIGISRDATDPQKSVYITNILPWRPPGNRTPSEQEAGMFTPFVIRHIQIANPDIVITMGNTPTKALLNTTTGIRRMRGGWHRHAPTDKPLLPTFHPAYLLRQPAEKRVAWFDLISVQKALEGELPV